MSQFITYRLPDGRIVPVAADVCRGASTIDFTLANGAIVLAVIEPEQALAPRFVPRCCFCGVERDDPRAALVCVAPANATAFHHFSEPAPAARIAALDSLSYAADKLDETAALLRAIAAEGGVGDMLPCYCLAERTDAVPEREPGICDLCGGRKLDAIDAVRR